MNSIKYGKYNFFHIQKSINTVIASSAKVHGIDTFKEEGCDAETYTLRTPLVDSLSLSGMKYYNWDDRISFDTGIHRNSRHNCLRKQSQCNQERNIPEINSKILTLKFSINNQKLACSNSMYITLYLFDHLTCQAWNKNKFLIKLQFLPNCRVRSHPVQ